jgi:hypothetical protein
MVECGAPAVWPNGRGPREPARNADEAGPKARLVERAVGVDAADYQLPDAGQEPEPTVVQERLTAPPPVFVIVKTLPDFDLALIV